MTKNSFLAEVTVKRFSMLLKVSLRAKMLHQKHKSYEFVLPLKNFLDLTSTSQEKKCHNLKIYILRKKTQKLKAWYFFTSRVTSIMSLTRQQNVLDNFLKETYNVTE